MGVNLQTYLIKLQRLQNKTIRIISKSPIQKSITPQCYRFKILKVNAKLIHQFTNKNALKNFDNYFTCSSNVSDYCIRQASDNNLFLTRFISSITVVALGFGGPVQSCRVFLEFQWVHYYLSHS